MPVHLYICAQDYSIVMNGFSENFQYQVHFAGDLTSEELRCCSLLLKGMFL